MTLETGAPTFLEGTHSATHDVNSPTAHSFTIYCRKTTHQCFTLILTTSLGSSVLSTIKCPFSYQGYRYQPLSLCFLPLRKSCLRKHMKYHMWLFTWISFKSWPEPFYTRKKELSWVIPGEIWTNPKFSYLQPGVLIHLTIVTLQGRTAGSPGISHLLHLIHSIVLWGTFELKILACSES